MNPAAFQAGMMTLTSTVVTGYPHAFRQVAAIGIPEDEALRSPDVYRASRHD